MQQSSESNNEVINVEQIITRICWRNVLRLCLVEMALSWMSSKQKIIPKDIASDEACGLHAVVEKKNPTL